MSSHTNVSLLNLCSLLVQGLGTRRRQTPSAFVALTSTSAWPPPCSTLLWPWRPECGVQSTCCRLARFSAVGPCQPKALAPALVLTEPHEQLAGRQRQYDITQHLSPAL